MIRIAFLVIAHEAPGPLIELAKTLTCEGDTVVIHYDLRSAQENYSTLEMAFHGNDNILLAPRVSCGWGEYSLVEATLSGLNAIRKSRREVDYVYLLSGADLPLKPIATLREFLGRHLEQKTEFIQSHPIRVQKWIVAGLEKERFIYHHIFNERRHPVYFNACWRIQRSLGIRRRRPAQLDISFGSQWWCLSWSTCIDIFNLISANPQIDKFFRTTWIPDESYFQTIIRLVVTPERISNYSLTYFQFNDYGKPVVYFDDHFDVLRRQNFFFGRKIASSARHLRDRLLEVGRSGVIEEINESLVGRYTIEYHAQRALRREPSSLFRSKGRYYDPSSADLPFLPQDVLVVITTSASIRLMAAPTSRVNEFILHGDLFEENNIRFADDRRTFGGYRSNDIGEREAFPFAFLSNIVAAGPDTTGFCINTSAEKRLKVVESLIRLPNTAVLALRPNSLVDATLAEIESRLLSFAPDRRVTTTEITNCISLALLSAQRLHHMVGLLIRNGNLWFSNGDCSLQTAVTPQEPLPSRFADAATHVLESHEMFMRHLIDHPMRQSVEELVRQRGAEHLWAATRIEPRTSPAQAVFEKDYSK